MYVQSCSGRYLGPADVARRTFRGGSSDIEDALSISITGLELDLSIAFRREDDVSVVGRRVRYGAATK